MNTIDGFSGGVDHLQQLDELLIADLLERNHVHLTFDEV